MNTRSTVEPDLATWLEQRSVAVEPVAIETLVGVDHAIGLVRSVLGRIRHPDGSPIPRALLLSGPPGTGKTLISRLIVGELGPVRAYDLPTESMTPEQIRGVFEALRTAPRSVVLLPEVDIIGLDRSSFLGDAETRRSLVALLEALDGLRPVVPDAGPIVIATTNRANRLDDALRRPGRFGTEVVFRLPDQAQRSALAARLMAGRFEPIDPTVIGALTRRWSQASITGAIDEAYGQALYARGQGARGTRDELIGAIRRSGRSVEASDVTLADRWRTAIHEAGHCVLARVLGLPVTSLRLSTDPREGSTDIGHEGRPASSGVIRHMVVAALGGVAAERVILGHPSMDAALDIRIATDLVLTRIEAGADEQMPPISREPWGQQLPAMLGQMLAERVTTCLTEARCEAEALIEARRSAVEHIATVLDARELLAGAELEETLKEAGL